MEGTNTHAWKTNIHIRRLLIFHKSPETSNYHASCYTHLRYDLELQKPRGRLLMSEGAGSLRKQRKRGNFRWWPSAKGRLSVEKIHPWIPHKEAADTPGSYLKDFKKPRPLPDEFSFGVSGPRPRFLIKP